MYIGFTSFYRAKRLVTVIDGKEAVFSHHSMLYGTKEPESPVGKYEIVNVYPYFEASRIVGSIVAGGYRIIATGWDDFASPVAMKDSWLAWVLAFLHPVIRRCEKFLSRFLHICRLLGIWDTKTKYPTPTFLGFEKDQKLTIRVRLIIIGIILRIIKTDRLRDSTGDFQVIYKWFWQNKEQYS